MTDSKKTYKIKEIHYTIQGEGANSGVPMFLTRLTGCNVWSGREEDRAKSAHKGMCAMWCDTDFKDMKGENGGKYTSKEFLEFLESTTYLTHFSSSGISKGSVSGRGKKGVVLFTGGEPLLQVDKELVYLLLKERFDVAIETNGSQDISAVIQARDWYNDGGGTSGVLWITVSPKPPMPIHESVYQHGVGEVKVVLDSEHIDPADYIDIPAEYYYIQPLDYSKMLEPKQGVSNPFTPQFNRNSVIACSEYVMSNPRWRLSSQQHKEWLLP